MSRGFVCVWCGERVWCPATPDLDHGELESPAARKHRRHIVNARHQSLPRAGQPQEGERMTRARRSLTVTGCCRSLRPWRAAASLAWRMEATASSSSSTTPKALAGTS